MTGHGWLLIALLASGACVALSFFLHARGRTTLSVLLLVMAGLSLRIFTSTEPFLHPWDERFHALVARNLVSHPLTPTLYDDPVLDYDYQNGFGNHIWLRKPPFALWLIAASLKVFGLNEFAVRIPSLALTSLSAVLTYRLGGLVFGSRVGLLAALIQMVNGYLIELGSGKRSSDHVDVVFIVLIELGIYLWAVFAQERKAFLLPIIGLVMGLAVLTKWWTALVILPVGAGFMLGSGQTRRTLSAMGLVLLLSLVVVMPWEIYIGRAFPAEAAYESRFNVLHFTDVVEGHAGPIYYHFVKMLGLFGEAVWLPVGWFIFRTLRGKESPGWKAVTAWFLLPYLFFSMAATKKPDYVMISAPAVFLMVARFWFHLHDQVRLGWPGRLRQALMILLVVLPLRDLAVRLKSFHVSTQDAKWADDLRWLRGRIGDPRPVLFNIEHSIEAMFYLGCPVYGSLPTSEQIQGLTDRGYAVVILDGAALPEGVRNDPRLKIVGRGSAP